MTHICKECGQEIDYRKKITDYGYDWNDFSGFGGSFCLVIPLPGKISKQIEFSNEKEAWEFARDYLKKID